MTNLGMSHGRDSPPPFLKLGDTQTHALLKTFFYKVRVDVHAANQFND
ncbi:hypothetical protein A359_09050 [secondary endosymbiont of Ctenarytaina eucalypti]|uniref:Uncharacterized protein n=1 Tax=secondary endosymbiont of Ctenarytaina eucalypti TaxID=1199245 RepID=J3VTG9_9ENTR|nr:hypothetical protein A359_09050 [secondary endosymbiont of Ctenarytaina eucalypti]